MNNINMNEWTFLKMYNLYTFIFLSTKTKFSIINKVVIEVLSLLSKLLKEYLEKNIKINVLKVCRKKRL